MSDLRFCPACGAQLPRFTGVSMRFCPGCGARLVGAADDHGNVGPVNGEPADDSVDEGRKPSAGAPVDGSTAGTASPFRAAAKADASCTGGLELHTACDASGGQALAQMALPQGWSIEEAHLERSGSFDCPISVGVTAAGSADERIV